MGGAGVGMPSRYLPATYLFLRVRRTDGLFKNLIAIVGMHGGIAVAVKNNCRDRRPVAGNDPATGSAALPHGGKCGGHVSGGPAGEAGMDPDRRIQIVVGCSHDSRSGVSGRQSADIYAFWINRIVAHDLAGNARDKRGLASAALLVGRAKPVPAFRRVGVAAL